MSQDVTETDKKLEDLYGLIKGIKSCMMTTRRRDGSLVSRAMTPREPNPKAADFWFFSNNASHKHDELTLDPQVNLSFFNTQTCEWVSVSGVARQVSDRDKIKELYQPDVKTWLGDLDDGVHNGGPEDPRLSLIFVEARTVHYNLQDIATPVKYFNIVRGMITREPPKVAAEHDLSKTELEAARRAEKVEK
ncbi:hypothetical protein BC936DRAFT_138671 [Jimgerdemannia flammicorona]|uniref:Uncharacterized protein n=2 Tax=Jimgerdemannia flammicorona TaxID=994334 RepID=A0A433BUU2_9FUNG|nr:hypothetical protein BC936DRAFT_138671 [Jimgerdemannia flammicorona]RUS25327.1 hypothetical protein BC938DRAFT_472325 [Jimgerdemannia flammicorona]